MFSTLAMLFFQDATASPEIPAGAGAAMGVIGFVYLAILLLAIIALWKIFTKAGKPGWAAIIPIYNIIVLLEIAGKPAWWVILMLVPFVNIIVAFIVAIAVAKNFGKGTGFGIGLALLGFIFGPILAFGDAQYNPQQ
jgi:hypothetical protein